MAETSSRTLRLLSLLQSRRRWSGPDLAGRLGVSARTLRRDVDRLRTLGYPVRASRGVDGGYELAPGAALPPLALDDEEAVALTVALRLATDGGATGGVSGSAEAAVRALAKVVQVLPPRLRRRVDALAAVTATGSWTPRGHRVDQTVLLTTAQACRSAEGLELRYTAADGTGSDRRVEPHHLVLLGGHWYLLAHDLDRGAWRTFRLDRVADVRPDGRRFRRRELPHPDPAEVVRAGSASAAARHAVRVELHCPADVARQRLGGWAGVEPLSTTTCRMSMSTDSLPWAVAAVVRAGSDVGAVEPPELLELLRTWSARFAAAG